MTADELISFWSELKDARVHPADLAFVKAQYFETSLCPVPWAGPLLNARVFLLFLNPGLSDSDVEYEKSRPDFVKTLRHNLSGSEPYIYLQERFQDHPGYRWAKQTFGKDASEAIAEKICVLQHVPYHSKEGGSAIRVAPQLPSTAAIRGFVQNSLLPRARKREIAVIVARATRLWGVCEEEGSDNICVYQGSESRRAYQTQNSRGGRLLRNFISKG